MNAPTKTRPHPADTTETTPGMRAWREAVENPAFHDLPYKVETNARGQLILTKHKIYHSFAQSRTLKLLEKHVHGDGETTVEFAAQTTDGVKVPGVVWVSDERATQIPSDAEASAVMPATCVEVLSRSNTQAEREDQRRLFFEGGAEEVWLVGADGRVTFYDAEGTLDQSGLAPDFPQRVEG